MDFPMSDRDPAPRGSGSLQQRIRELEALNQELEERLRTGEGGATLPPHASTAQAWLAAIVESSDDAIISKTLDGTVTSWNPAAQRLLGFRAEDMIGRSILRIVPPELRKEEERILELIRSGQPVERYETTRLRNDGSRVRVCLTVSPVRDGTGAIIGASKIARNVAPSLEADRDRATLAEIVASTDDAIISKSLTGIVTSWNPAAERLYGFRAEEMIGRPIAMIIPPHLQEEEAQILAKIKAGERIEHFETARLRKDGVLVEVSITVSPVRDSTGRVIGASKIARDITQQRESQRRKDEFLAVLAHELRNPLGPIRNAISLFAQPTMNDTLRARVLAIADRQIQHMARLLDDLLDVSRISTGRVELQRSRVDLNLLADEAVDATRALMADRKHELRLAKGAEPIWLDADPVRITQILVNLLNNAAKYSDPGSRIELAVARQGDEAVLSVSDNGIGFAKEMKERLFTLFSQEKRAQSHAAGGLGIGLALVRDFAQRHGGRVEAFSAGADRGSRFVVHLPALSE